MATMTEVRDVRSLAQEALGVQDAVNPLGVTKSFAKATQELADYLRSVDQLSTDKVCRHPIFQCWASKIADMAGLREAEDHGKALCKCHALTES